MPKYKLPELPYDFSALEPHISAPIMELHHGKHHATYVKNANAALEQFDEARANSDWSRVAPLERELAFNLSGHILHSILWVEHDVRTVGRRARGGLPARSNAISAVRSKAAHPPTGHHHGLRLAALVWEPVGGSTHDPIYDHHPT